MIKITFIFETLEEASDFLNKKLEPQSKPKKLNDMRGRSTKDFHKKAKEYHIEHPDKTYRTCLKELKQLNKNTIEPE